jgi:lysylphosphatidylglycerol synthetase-like protein (DUF2156 family)
MRRLIVAGLLYLTGIAVLLVIKPQFMFQEDGRWKEFGIGRDQSRFTYMPLWLFAILWAVVSYMIVFLIEDNVLYSDEEQIPRNRNIRNTKRNVPQELVPGYYMLNETSTARNGVPRYVYLGPEEPTT